jgi:hypothetical protein
MADLEVKWKDLVANYLEEGEESERVFEQGKS